MATKEEYAALSAQIYSNVRSDENAPKVPSGWSRVTPEFTLADAVNHAGFSGGIYIKPGIGNSGEVVVAYKGTDFYFGDRLWDSVQDIMADVALGSGLFSSKQVREAASMAADAAIRYPEYSMSFADGNIYSQSEFLQRTFDAASFYTQTGDDLDDQLVGGSGNDTLTGSAANDLEYWMVA